jgi:hypothetical protein
MGYSTYLTFVLGYVTTLVTVYYLAIKNVPSLLTLFPKFLPFSALATVVGVPLTVIIGWIHLKRSRLYSSETDVGAEANPYNYKSTPGKEIELNWPVSLMYLRLLEKLAETNGLLTEQDRMELQVMKEKMSIIIKGGYIGSPRRTTNF